MNYHVLTLFPEMIEQGVGTSITGRAIRNNTLSLEAVNIRDFSLDKRRRVDDYTYGGGAGMLMQAQPVYDAYRCVRDHIPGDNTVRTIYVTPQGHTFTQHMAEELAMADDLIFLCGHYEGIDERVLEEVVTDYVSIGDYVLTGGELAAMVMIDAISRMVPGVLHNDVSADTESFHGNLLEYPQYTRPEIWHGKSVPGELLTGDPKAAAAWRLEHSIERTRERRPDLYARYQAASACRDRLMTEKLSNMDLISQIDQGHYELLAQKGDVLLRNPLSGTLYYTSFIKGGEDGKRIPREEIVGEIKADRCREAFLRGENAMDIADLLSEAGAESLYRMQSLTMFVLTRREKLPVTGLYRPDGKATAAGLVIRSAALSGCDREQVLEMMTEAGIDSTAALSLYKRDKVSLCLQGQQAIGFAAESNEGAVETVYVRETPDKTRAEKALLTYALNELLGRGKVPYLYTDQEDRLAGLAAELGMYPSKIPVLRIKKV